MNETKEPPSDVMREWLSPKTIQMPSALRQQHESNYRKLSKWNIQFWCIHTLASLPRNCPIERALATLGALPCSQPTSLASSMVSLTSTFHFYQEDCALFSNGSDSLPYWILCCPKTASWRLCDVEQRFHPTTLCQDDCYELFEPSVNRRPLREMIEIKKIIC